MEFSFFNYFLTRFIPEGTQFRTFSLPHFLYLAAGALFILLMARKVSKAAPGKGERIVRVLCILLFLLYFYRFYMFYRFDWQYDFLDNLPFHLCILNQFVIPIAVYTKSKLLLNFSYAIGIPAAAIAMITPSELYKQYHPLSWFALFFFIVHVLIVAIPILAIRAKLFRPSSRMYWKVAGVLFAYVAVIYPINKLLGANYMFLNIPEPGTPMEPLYHWLGTPGYIAPLVVVLLVVVAAMYFPWWLADKRAEKAAIPVEQAGETALEA